jgi:hypothetical protein
MEWIKTTANLRSMTHVAPMAVSMISNSMPISGSSSRSWATKTCRGNSAGHDEMEWAVSKRSVEIACLDEHGVVVSGPRSDIRDAAG